MVCAYNLVVAIIVSRPYVSTWGWARSRRSSRSPTTTAAETIRRDISKGRRGLAASRGSRRACTCPRPKVGWCRLLTQERLVRGRKRLMQVLWCIEVNEYRIDEGKIALRFFRFKKARVSGSVVIARTFGAAAARRRRWLPALVRVCHGQSPRLRRRASAERQADRARNGGARLGNAPHYQAFA